MGDPGIGMPSRVAAVAENDGVGISPGGVVALTASAGVHAVLLSSAVVSGSVRDKPVCIAPKAGHGAPMGAVDGVIAELGLWVNEKAGQPER